MPTWGEDWGGLWGATTDAQVLLPDTIWFGDDPTGTPANLAVDESQVATNMTAAATWIYEAAPASRFNVLTRWTMDALVDMNNTDTGRIWTQGGTGRWRISVAAGVISATLQIGAALVTVATLTLPGVSGSDERFLISWAAEPNPATTGASDALRTELRAWNITDGTYDQTVTTHGARDTETGAAVWGAGSTAGASPFTGVIYACRFGTAFHHSQTVRESFLSNVAPPALLGESRREVIVPPKSTGLGDDGQLAGPLFLRAALDTRQRDLWLAGPLVNEQYWDLVDHDGDRSVSNLTWCIEDPDDANRYLYVAYLYRRPVPPSVNKVAARVFFQQYETIPGSPDDFTITLHSMSQPGPLYRPPTSPATYERHVASSGIMNEEHGSGATAGEWVDIGPCNVARDLQGYTYLCLGFESRNQAANQRWRIKALTINPVFSTVSAGAFT
jgi:hypothetical protein